MESGLQEIGHSRSHSCSPAPEEAWIEPGKCQISLKSVRIWRHFAHFSDSWGLSQASKKCFFDQNHNSVLIEVYFNNMTLVSSPQTAPKAPTDHRNNSRCFGTAKSQDPGFGSGSARGKFDIFRARSKLPLVPGSKSATSDARFLAYHSPKTLLE